MNYERVLETYSFQELLEYNDLTEDEVLEYLVDTNYIRLPILPVDCL